MDANREEAINWARSNQCDFVNPVYPPPSGWMWAEGFGEGRLGFIAIFTGPDYDDITIEDIKPA